MNDKDAYIEHLEKTIDNLQNQVNNLTEIVLLLRKESEVEADASVPEPIKADVKGYVRTNVKTKREEIIKDLPVREILSESATDDMQCPRCGTELKPIGKETVREELEYIPAKLQIVRYVRMAYECPKCKHTKFPYIQKANTPTWLMNHSLASPSSVANVMYQKYVNSIPLYRQEKDWEQLGIFLSRATMANWIIRCSQDHLSPVITHLQEELLKRDIIHCDETPVQVLKEKGKKPQSKSYMWLYGTGNDGKAPVILYDYQPSRNGDNAAKFLADFNGYVHADGYSGYNKLTGITRCGLLDGRCSISNNAAENAIRPFTVGRKNWLFADTPKGASASAAVYSIVETAKANGLNVYTYLEYLLLYMPDADWRNHPEELDVLMPWTVAVQAECKR